jgi:ABC-type phosphate/phosphonate transport system substrate-binding protein
MHSLWNEKIMTQTTKLLTRSIMPLVIAGLLSAVGGQASSQTKPLQIGLAKSFVQDRAKSVVAISADEFKDVVKKTTGLDSEIGSHDGPFELAEKLKSKQRDFGVFHAHEFAWVKEKYPDLQPLLIAVNKRHAERALLIVHQNDPAKTIADLRGKTLDLPTGTKESCRMFLGKLCADQAKQTPTAFFGSLAKSASPIAALDEVARGKAQATVVDTVALEFYKEVKAAVFEKNLKILQQSEAFPASVIVYKKGALDEATVKQFREGLLKAHTIPVGGDMMKSWNIDAFEPIPKEYAMSLADILKRYPTPASPR